MIKRWLLKHRWVNELLKAVVATFFGLFGYACWEAGKLASLDIQPPHTYKIMLFGILVGIMGMLSLFILIDAIYSVIGVFKQRHAKRAETMVDKNRELG